MLTYCIQALPRTPRECVAWLMPLTLRGSGEEQGELGRRRGDNTHRPVAGAPAVSGSPGRGQSAPLPPLLSLCSDPVALPRNPSESSFSCVRGKLCTRCAFCPRSRNRSITFLSTSSVLQGGGAASVLQEKQRHKGVCTGLLVTSSYLSVVRQSQVFVWKLKHHPVKKRERDSLQVSPGRGQA